MENEIENLIKQRNELIGRLNNGESKIEVAKATGLYQNKPISLEKLDKWEDAWIEILHELEAVYERIAFLEKGVKSLEN